MRRRGRAQLKLVNKGVIGGVMGKVLPAIVLDIQDAYGNVVTNNASRVVMRIVEGPAGGVISSGGSVNAKGGLVAFSSVLLSKAGRYVVSVSDLSLAVKAGVLVTVNVGGAVSGGLKT